MRMASPEAGTRICSLWYFIPNEELGMFTYDCVTTPVNQVDFNAKTTIYGILAGT